MEKINFKPRAGYILVTSNLVKKASTGLLLGKQAPEIKEIQRVVAIGDDVSLKVGEYIMLNLQNFVQTVKKQSTIRAGIGGQDMISEQIVIPFFSVPGNEEVFIKINAREIEGTIPDYDALPEEIKNFISLTDFTREQDTLDKESKEVLSKGMKYPDSFKDSAAPAVRTDSSKIKMY